MWVLFSLFFKFSDFYRLYLQNKTRVALANPWWNICKTELRIGPYSYGKCMFVNILTSCIDPPNRVDIHIQRHNPISFKTQIFIMCALWSSPNHTPIKYMSPIKKTNHLRPSTFMKMATCRHFLLRPIIPTLVS